MSHHLTYFNPTVILGIYEFLTLSRNNWRGKGILKILSLNFGFNSPGLEILHTGRPHHATIYQNRNKEPYMR